MKLEVVAGERGRRKKDFWDIHELSDHYGLPAMIAFHKERYPYSHDEELIRQNMVDFTRAEEDLNPGCLLGKHWEVVKLEIIDWVEQSKN